MESVGFRGNGDMKYAKAISDGESINMIVNILVGVDAKIEATFLIRIIERCSYPIRGMPKKMPEILYQKALKIVNDQDTAL